MRKSIRILIVFLLLTCVLGTGCSPDAAGEQGANSQTSAVQNLRDVPSYSGEPYVAINDNEPEFSKQDLTTESFESYSDLDSLGRCGVAYANVGADLMPTERRGSISQVKPSGWHSVRYDIVEGDSLYNRCHLIGYQLTGENANEENLITGTRAMNVDGMLPFEDMVADYVKETDNHVLYRVTPVFQGDDLVASGVQMEAQSVEDQGEGVSFNVYVYNNQPGISIDYATGDSCLSGEETDEKAQSKADGTAQANTETYVLNTNTKKFHRPDCSSVDDMKESNKEIFKGTRNQLVKQGYDPCGNCM